MEKPLSVSSKRSSSAGSKSDSVELVTTISVHGETPEDLATDDAMKEGVTQLLMTLSRREQQVGVG